MPSECITNLLEDIRSLNDEHFELIQALRKLIYEMDASVVEEVKYGGFLFSVGKPFCGIFPYTKHVSLEFGAGASLPDKNKVLEGGGKLRRHIKLICIRDIENKQVGDYLDLALKAAQQV